MLGCPGVMCWQYHRTREAFARDRRRDRLALREGFRVARFTAVEVQRAPRGLAEELRVLLGARIRDGS
jgi:very-short-patch-repair endonuclease